MFLSYHLFFYYLILQPNYQIEYAFVFVRCFPHFPISELFIVHLPSKNMAEAARLVCFINPFVNNVAYKGCQMVYRSWWWYLCI